jgi:hypothetical protein
MLNFLTPSSTRQRHAFTPEYYKDVVPKPIFWLRSASFSDRSAYVAELRAEAGPEVYSYMKDAAFQEGLLALCPDDAANPKISDDRAKMIDILGQLRAGETVSPQDQVEFTKVWESIQNAWSPLKMLTQRDAMRDEMRAGLALLHFCIGLDNVKDVSGNAIDFECDSQGKMKETVLMKINDADVFFVGTAAHDLQYGRSVEKNLLSPSECEAKSEPLPTDLSDLG